MSTDISNRDDVIDSRDVIARIEELESERDSYDASDEELSDERRAQLWEDNNPDEADELKALTALQDQAEGYASDWRHGGTLIRDSYFEDYARQLAEDIGAIPEDAAWPCTCIDWKQAAEELQTDYTSVDFDGVTYWIR